MNRNELLRYQLSLLLLAHGEKAILGELARLVGQDEQQLLTLLQDIDKVGHVQTKRAPKQRRSSTTEALLEKYPEKSHLVQALGDRFDNRTFLRELMDVRRFLERHSQSSRSLKSRADARGKVLRVLIELPVRELETLLSQPASEEYSSLGAISDEILGRK
jgi:hypothetical protein